MKKLFALLFLLFALALRTSRSLQATGDHVTSDLSRTPANGTRHAERQIAATLATAESSWRQNSTESAAASSSTEDATDPDGGYVQDGRAVDSGERGGGDGAGDEDSGLASDGGRVAELYEDLEDSVVFEDSEANGEPTGGGGRLLDEQRLPAENGASPLVPVAAADNESAAVSAEEYDAGVGTEEDASPAGSSPVIVQRYIKYPEYVGSSSYRRSLHGGNVTRPEDVFRFWDPSEWTATSKISTECIDHMQQYQSALRNGKIWAFKSK